MRLEITQVVLAMGAVQINTFSQRDLMKGVKALE